VSYTINASKLKQIYGYNLQIRTRDGSDATIRIPDQPPGWPRGGVEAYGLKVDLDITRKKTSEKILAFLKIFKTEVPERERRTRLLIDMELAKKSDYFSGVPFGWLGHLNINGVDVIAHFTRMIRGPYAGGPEDFGRLRSSGRWAPIDNQSRRSFAAELAVSIAGLERAGIVHGDISPGNILMGHSSSGDDICILCDYDGYNHQRVPRLPRKNAKLACRPLGSPGYQYPDLISSLESDSQNDGDIWVQTDRFALGVAVCEMVVWSDDVENILQKEGRGQLLPNELLKSRSLSKLPQRIIDIFPQGFMLLERALQANTPASMPSPEDWLRVLGFDDPATEYRGSPVVTVFQTRGNSRIKHDSYRLSNASGDFGKIAPNLQGSRYRFEDSKVEFAFVAGLAVKRRRAGRLADVTAGVGYVVANPGDVYYAGGWELEITDRINVGPTAQKP
jgi:serine/threonine protein kinase